MQQQQQQREEEEERTYIATRAIMGSPSELTLDYKPNSIPKPPSSIVDDQPADQSRKLEDFLARLEEERHKIEAFKRELPLSMQLLNNAMESYRQQLGTYKRNQEAKPVLEEFIPLSSMSIDGSEKAPAAPSEKASWMVSAQLWGPAAAKEDGCSLDSRQRNGGGAFLPFSKEKTSGAAAALPELALAPAEKAETEEKKNIEQAETPKGQVAAAAQSAQRKARRCWSPDLHRRFVNALQMLGGSQAATPKQIRELMKVDGLTNDEVKSHLQKYRLHTRRPNPQPQPTAAAAPQLVVLGGIWVPPEYAAAGPAIYGAHPSPHYSVPHDFYGVPQPPSAHHLHRGAPAYKMAVRSPESEIRSGGGDRSTDSVQEEEQDDDEGHGREEEEEEEEEEDGDVVKGEEKALVPADNNGSSDVALKF